MATPRRTTTGPRPPLRVPIAFLCALVLALLSLCLLAAPRAAEAATFGVDSPIPFALFPTDNPWNTRVDTAPVDPNSAAYLRSMGLTTGLHPDFGTTWDGAPNGIPYVTVSGTQKTVPVSFDYADESDPGPYPIPSDAPIEGGPSSDGDRHVLVLDTGNKKLYELFAAYPQSDGSWKAGSGAIFDLTSNATRPAGWTSADAAGLPILPGLARYDEAVTEGVIDHALRFTVAQTQKAYLYPATHYASSDTDPDLPPMGLRVRLKAGFDISSFSPEVQVILQALKTYGMMVADNGSNWYVSGAPDPRWNDDHLSELSKVKGSDFEVVDTRAMQPAALVVSAGGDAALREGQSFARSGSFRDEGADTAWTATVDYGGGSQALALAGDHSFSLAHRYRVAGTYLAVVTVHGNDGTVGTTRFKAVVRNVAPHVRAQRPAVVRPGVVLRRRIVFTDPGADKWRTVIVWGDGSQGRRPFGRSHSFLLGHVYHRHGLFTVTVRVFDRHGGSGAARFKVRVRV
jgi:PKD domain